MECVNDVTLSKICITLPNVNTFKLVFTKYIDHETSHVIVLVTQAHDYPGEFHMAIKKQIIDI